MQDWCMGKDFKTFIPLSVIWDSFSGSLPESILGNLPLFDHCSSIVCTIAKRFFNLALCEDDKNNFMKMA